MPDLSLALAPVSDAVTHDVRAEVRPRHKLFTNLGCISSSFLFAETTWFRPPSAGKAAQAAPATHSYTGVSPRAGCENNYLAPAPAEIPPVRFTLVAKLMPKRGDVLK